MPNLTPINVVRVTSKNPLFMAELQRQFGIRYSRVFPEKWWWIFDRFHIIIPVEDNRSRCVSEILTVASRVGCYKFEMLNVDNYLGKIHYMS